MDGRALRTGDPAQLAGYRVVRRLGEGGQGAVFLGQTGDHSVAIKLLHAEVSEDPQARERFLREVSAGRRVARFCTAQMLSVGLLDNRPYIVSEYVEGPSLQQGVLRAGPRGGAVLERLAIGTATALAAIHSAGVIHRDFKPHNVLLGPDGPRVIDFGIAKALDVSTVVTSQVVGTPAYMAPEQIAGETAGQAADLFAWGGTILFACSGEAPFGMTSIPNTLHRILNTDPDLGQLRGTLRALVGDCLAKNPADRPTAREVLLTLLAETGTETTPLSGLDEATGEPSAVPDETTVRLLTEGATRTVHAVRFDQTTVDVGSQAGAPVAPPGSAQPAGHRPGVPPWGSVQQDGAPTALSGSGTAGETAAAATRPMPDQTAPQSTRPSAGGPPGSSRPLGDGSPAVTRPANGGTPGSTQPFDGGTPGSTQPLTDADKAGPPRAGDESAAGKQPPPKRRALQIALALIVVVLLAAGAATAYLVYRNAATATAIPKTFAGSWEGTGSDSNGDFPLAVHFRDGGKVAAPRSGASSCLNGTLTFKSGNDEQMRMSWDPPGDCVDSMVTFTLKGESRILFRVEPNSDTVPPFEGELHKK